MDDEIEETLAAVGPRLRAVREQRQTTLAQLSQTTGVSVSTLSRLESGGRKLTLELLLRLAHAHDMPVDELLTEPPTSDPRIQGEPITRNGRRMLPLTRRHGGVQAYKITRPGTVPLNVAEEANTSALDDSTPERRYHSSQPTTGRPRSTST